MKIKLAIFVLLFGIIFLKLNTKYWDGKNKINVVSHDSFGNISVTVVDPKFDEVVTLIIPGETEVTVARNLGTLRLKNVWQLGVNENLEGNLLAETITRDFFFPVVLWRGPNGETNIPVGDRLFLKLFNITTKGLDRTEIDLGKSQYLRKEKLDDGEMGFKIPGEISDRLTVYFVDNDLVDRSVRVYISDATGTFGVSQTVGKIIEVMGGKIIRVEKLPVAEFDCAVLGKDKKLISKISRLFSCSSGDGDFDLQIKLGKSFAERF